MATIVTLEEISQLRTQLLNHPEASEALDTIQECDGYLEDAIALMSQQESERGDTRGLNEWYQTVSKVICREEFKDDLAIPLIVAVLEPSSLGLGIPPGIATAVAIYAFKVGTKRFCSSFKDAP